MSAIQIDSAAKAYRRALILHPDPRDPDWPGHADTSEGVTLKDVAESMELARDWCASAAYAAHHGRAHDARQHLQEAEELIRGIFDQLRIAKP